MARSCCASPPSDGCASCRGPATTPWRWATTPAAGLDEAAAIQVSGYTVASGLASAAVRLGCLGALPAQAALRDVLPLIAEAVALIADEILEGARRPHGG